MGTSASSMGARNNSPIIPEWLVPETGNCLTPANRFNQPRKFAREFLRTSDSSCVKRALKEYVRKSLGGHSSAGLRFVSFGKVAADIFSSLHGEGFVKEVNIRNLSGLSPNEVLDLILSQCCPVNGDADKIRDACIEAYSNTQDKYPNLDPLNLTDEQLAYLITEMLSQMLFYQSVNDLGKAFFASASPKAKIELENQVLDLIREITDKALAEEKKILGDWPLTREQWWGLWKKVMDTVFRIIEEEE